MPGGTNQTLHPFLWRAANLYPETEVVSRTADGIERYDYETYYGRVAQLANALDAAGVEEGDRIATFCWNHHRHFEAYFAIPDMGAQLHTINPLLPAHHIQYIVENAADKVMFVDPSLLAPFEAASDDESFDVVEQYVIMGDTVPETTLDPVVDYESFIDGHDDTYDWPELPESQPAGLCYTSGTTGKPKGVEYTQQMLWAHTMATNVNAGLGFTDDDVIMPVVPMFHANAWGMPFSATAAGAKHVYPGPAPSPEDIANLIENEGVTFAAGVPTVWLGLLEYLKENDADLSTLDTVVIGGSAAPKSVIEAYDDMGIEIVHAWGMTEMAPIGSVAHLKHHMEDWPYDDQLEYRAKQGLTVPGLEFKVVGEDGEIDWNGEDYGELWVRAPWVTTEYFKRPDANRDNFEDGWLKTGDVVTVDDEGYIKIVDRSKDVIKSGGEWISSVELENELMAHDNVTEATVIGVAHERWQERPVAFVVKSGDIDDDTLERELVERIEAAYPKWWRPDEVLFIDEIPKTATGKFSKVTLREQYGDQDLLEGTAPADAAPD